MKTLELEQQETSSNALKWLIEMEQVSNPHFINALILNIFKIHKNIKDVQILTDSTNKRMLIWIDVKFRFFANSKKTILNEQVLNMLTDILPSYDFRVVFDKSIFDKAIEIIHGKK